jgi:hypothetical protein
VKREPTSSVSQEPILVQQVSPKTGVTQMHNVLPKPSSDSLDANLPRSSCRIIRRMPRTQSADESHQKVLDAPPSRPRRVLRTVSAPMVKREPTSSVSCKPIQQASHKTGVTHTKQPSPMETVEAMNSVNGSCSSLKSPKHAECDWKSHAPFLAKSA